MTPPPAKVWAGENGIKYIQPASLKSIPEELSGFSAQGRPASGWDLFVVASYGKIIPQDILDLPKHGALNVHPSLLPKYRGASPLEYQILNGEEEVGVTIMLMDAEMDHGPIIRSEILHPKTEISNIYYQELRDETAELGGEMLAEIMPKWIAGDLKSEPQNHAEATFTKKIEKEDGLIDLSGDPILNYRKIRAFTPWPGTYFYVSKGDKKIRVVIRKARPDNNELIIERVIPEGKSEMNWEDFKRNLT